uniref:Uncharacterized protein n=1 Tax=Arundo donax TaxID=35708 RepID=A0A0A9FM47_ARUDO
MSTAACCPTFPQSNLPIFFLWTANNEAWMVAHPQAF